MANVQPSPGSQVPVPKPKLLWWLLPVLVGIALVGLFLPRSWGMLPAWIIVGFLTLAACGFIGASRGMGLAGILIDAGRNMMSLSRLQIVLWTCLILSAFVTTALGRYGDYAFSKDAYVCETMQTGQELTDEQKCAEPLAIQLPPLLWALMGISVTTAVGSPLLKANKAQRTAEEDRRKEANRQVRLASGVQAASAPTYGAVLTERRDSNEAAVQDAGDAVGVMVRKASWQDANFADVFTGEEVATYGYVDIAKLQNFFFTMIAVIAYAVALGVEMAWAQTNVSSFFLFPDLPESLIAVIGISHTGYLTDKAFTHATPK
jgi:hypothetical protein